MSLGAYVGVTYDLAEELKESLSYEESECLREKLSGRPIQEWWKWKEKYSKEISAFVASTPSERKRKKSYRELQPYIYLAAYQHCAEGYSVLKAIESHFLFQGCSYRDMASSAGDAFQTISAIYVEDWPYDNDNPFVYDNNNT